MDSSGDTTVVSVWRTLRLLFGVVPIVAGLDKFTNLLVYWPKYVAPALARVLPMSSHTFMLAVGVIEIVAGLAVLLSPWPRTFGYVVAAWLTGIAINLIAAGYFDIAVRDLVMAVTAVSFARLGAVVPHARHAHRPLKHAPASL
jgi:uncharacterized membrane protein YphA (DoxX/SURF4 family)